LGIIIAIVIVSAMIIGVIIYSAVTLDRTDKDAICLPIISDLGFVDSR